MRFPKPVLEWCTMRKARVLETSKLPGVVVVLLCLGLGPAGAEEEKGVVFQPPGMWIWDNWFVHDGDQWHAFYLQLPKAVGPERRWKNNDFYKHVGHAVSRDLFHWTDQGSALCALSGTWNDRHIATGSIIRHEERWWKFFTGRGTGGDGVGIALSEDLTTWKTEPAPVVPLIDTFATQSDSYFEAEWEGDPVRWIGISDPYIYPEAVEGWFYLVLCSRILDVPIAESGCLTLMRSRDLRSWESAGILAWPRCFERMETPQLWVRDGRWILSFGGVINSPWAAENPDRFPDVVRGRRSHLNYFYRFDHFPDGEGEGILHALETPGYILKTIRLEDGSDVAFFTASDSLSIPYRVLYEEDGGIRFEALEKRAAGSGEPQE